MKIYFFSDFVAYLKYELSQRIAADSNYNRSQFASDLGLSHNRLSEVLSYKLGLSRTAAKNIADRMELPSGEAEYFCDLVDSRHARSVEARQMADERVGKKHVLRSHTISTEDFSNIADGLYFLLVELLKIPGLNTSAALAIRTKKDEDVILQKLSVLERAGLVRSQAGLWEAVVRRYHSEGAGPSKAVRNFHGSVIDGAKAALSGQSVDERLVCSALVATTHEKFLEARQRIEAFVQALSADMADARPKSAVYALSVQLYDAAHPQVLNAWMHEKEEF